MERAGTVVCEDTAEEEEGLNTPVEEGLNTPVVEEVYVEGGWENRWVEVGACEEEVGG